MSVTSGGIFSFEGVVPVINPAAFVHPNATLIGDVVIAARCYVGPGAVLRGDLARVDMRMGSNVQDNCVLHTLPGVDVVIEEDGHVGHGAALHSCTIKRNAMVGINAIVLDHAVIGENSIVGAAAFVPAGFHVPERSLVIGVPAAVQRSLTDAEIANKLAGTRIYHHLALRSLQTMKRCTPLSVLELDRPRVPLVHGTN